jgi:hypothetical protein
MAILRIRNCGLSNGHFGVARAIVQVLVVIAIVDADGDAIRAPGHLVTMEFVARIRNRRGGGAVIAACD